MKRIHFAMSCTFELMEPAETGVVDVPVGDRHGAFGLDEDCAERQHSPGPAVP